MVVSLFETGYLRTGAGLFHSDLAHLSGHSAGRAMAIRLADAMRRGAWCHDREGGSDSVDFLRQGWFAWRPSARRGALPVRPAAQVAGGHFRQVGEPWAPGGISPFQLNAGRAMATQQEREYDSYCASPE
jgi:hypothetical protein